MMIDFKQLSEPKTIFYVSYSPNHLGKLYLYHNDLNVYTIIFVASHQAKPPEQNNPMAVFISELLVGEISSQKFPHFP